MTPTAKVRAGVSWGAGAWSAPAEALLTAADGTRVHAVHTPARALPGAAPGGSGTAFVVAHGFTGAVERPAVRRAVGVLSHHGGVVAFSFRGHGRSGGLSTVGDREVLDLEAAAAWARSLGYRRIATVGFSMGGAVVVRHAALYGGVAAVAAVSAPARWYYRGTAPMRRLHRVVMHPLGRAVARHGLGTRIDPRDWAEVPVPPVEAAGMLGAVPLLVVHGDRDAYFPLDHPRSLHGAARAAGTESELWIEPGFGHAENSAGEELLHRIAGRLAERAAAAGEPAPAGAGRTAGHDGRRDAAGGGA
ncbi:alpha/beta fold hydrolase [Streptacidiphilus sp. ASG 303]|uniref:alpha/beta hydrolase n=1 Tax=Streptacidiphilus sp. ASG 303 TaxID=2896847 RepID=UPI001E2882A0|nr:alpha/beta fold hydrolase [Streptacidiphilus sp. ASG 303]MCD0485593.1 alpha/beta fold hydrolase [Streptacidiphilus sp. ASG 303]